MAKFTDRFNRSWTLEITVQDIKNVRKALGVDLFDAFAGDYGVYSEVVSDVEKLVAVAYVLCKEQIAAAGITEEDFGRGMAGDALRSLGDAFGEALVDFFPNARARDLVRATLSKARELVDLRTDLLAQVVGGLEIASLVGKPSSGSTAAPASSDSPPAPSPSAN